MEFEVRKTKPESMKKYLVQQVEEVSPLCDVTVKLGTWEKRFHSCILVISAFFEHALSGNFVEQTTGCIEMTMGTAVTLEMAIMFLYGKKPQLNKENIEHLLNLAEFLLIPNLKATCVTWLRNATITDENCMKYFEMSCRYNFEIVKCEQYLMAHMSEMLEKPQMVNLTNESVEFILTERKLSYVSMDEKLKFLIKWINDRYNSRYIYFKTLLEFVDLNEVENTTLEKLSTIPFVKDELNIGILLNDERRNENRDSKVLIMRGEKNDGKFWCFDLERKKWFNLSPDLSVECTAYHNCAIAGSLGMDSKIYFTKKNQHSNEIIVLNLKERFCKIYSLTNDNNVIFTFNDIRDVCVGEDICCGYANNTMLIDERGRHVVRHAYGNIHDQMHQKNHLTIATIGLKNLEIRDRYIDFSTIYLGYLSNDENVKMSPVFTFRKEAIRTIKINRMHTAVIIFQSSTYVALYDFFDYSLEKKELKINFDDIIAPSDAGFVIYNNKRCLHISRISGPSLSTKYIVKEVLFDASEFYNDKYIFCGNTWYHYYREQYSTSYVFESVSQDELMSAGSSETLTWQSLPLPLDADKCKPWTINDMFFETIVPKDMLRCDIKCKCLHCQWENTSTRGTYVSPDSDSSYGDSDDDYYGYEYDDYPDYYYSSD